MRLFSQRRKRDGEGDLGQSAWLHGSRRTPTPRARPSLEALEDRRLLTGGVLDPTFGTGVLSFHRLTLCQPLWRRTRRRERPTTARSLLSAMKSAPVER